MISSSRQIRKIGVIGGGASGMFAATTAASTVLAHPSSLSSSSVKVRVLESSSRLLKKVKISGGGRCNLLHDTSHSPSELLKGYPRGKKELNGVFHRYFSPKDAERWFTDRGVKVKTEVDGRMFPVTDSSQTVIDCITNDADKNGVETIMSNKVVSINNVDNQFLVSVKDRNTDANIRVEIYDAIILATGSFPPGHALAASLQHSITKCVPSLFTLNTKDHVKEGQLLHNLSGISIHNVRLTLKVDAVSNTAKKKKSIVQEGPLLITHHGISGPAALRLSAFAAQEFHSANYRARVVVHWAPGSGSVNDIESLLWQMTVISPKRCVTSFCPLLLKPDSDAGLLSPPSPVSAIPRRLWSALVLEAGFGKHTMWCEASKKKVRTLSRLVAEYNMDITSKSIYKDEFVTAGGVSLKEVIMKRMESKVCNGLFFCGEVCDIDGVTGGFNFLNCWSTGYIAGKNAAEYVLGIPMK